VDDLIAKDLAADAAQRLVDALHKSPKADPWLVAMCEGSLQVRLAWDARGHGYAKSVTQEGWRLFEKHLAAAKACLERAYSLDPARPEAATEMITVARAGATDKTQGPQFWFERAHHAQSDYSPAHHSMLTSLLPRWGGDYEQMTAFGLRCAQGDPNTLEPLWLVRSLAWCSDDSGAEAVLFKNPKAYEAVHSAISLMRQSPANADAAGFLDYIDAAAAWHAKKYTKARAILEHAKACTTNEAYVLMHADPDDVIYDVFILGNSDPNIRAALAAAGKEQWDQACQSYQAALDGAGEGNPLLVRALRDRLASARISRDLRAGGWSELPFAQNLPGWRHSDMPGWSAYSARTSPTPASPGTYCLYVHDAVGPRWSMTQTIDLPVNSTPETGAQFLTGFIMAGRTSEGRPSRLSIQLCPAGGNIFLTGAGMNIEKKLGKMPLSGTTLRVDVFDRRIVCHVNGRAVIDSTVPDTIDWNPGDKAALMLVYNERSDLGVHVKDVKVRVLTQVTQVNE
jgi:hypothetical protein